MIRAKQCMIRARSLIGSCLKKCPNEKNLLASIKIILKQSHNGAKSLQTKEILYLMYFYTQNKQSLQYT